MSRLFAFIQRNEHRFSSLVFIVGFVTDLLTFTLLDLPVVNLLFLAYIALAVVFTLLAHAFRRYALEGSSWRRMVAVLSPLAATFTIGGLLSGFLIFYTKSAAVSVSWPFLLMLALIFLGHEFFRSYRSHIAFQAVLLFFALYAYLIFTLPMYAHRLGPSVFLWSTDLAVLFFALFISMLALAGRRDLEVALPRIIGGTAFTTLTVVLLYFSGLVPPIPLTVKESGIYHHVVRIPEGYQITHERFGRWSRFIERTVHHVPGTPLYAYGAIFAPPAFSANVVHRWERYDEAKGVWVTESAVAFTLAGGRAGGYRGYTEKSDPAPGKWRVSTETTEGQVIGRLRFRVVNVNQSPPLYTDRR